MICDNYIDFDNPDCDKIHLLLMIYNNSIIKDQLIMVYFLRFKKTVELTYFKNKLEKFFSGAG